MTDNAGWLDLWLQKSKDTNGWVDFDCAQKGKRKKQSFARKIGAAFAALLFLRIYTKRIAGRLGGRFSPSVFVSC